MLQTVQFVLSSATADDRVVAALRARHRVELAAPEHQTRVYFDTFDWRLYAAGLMLTQHIADDDRVLTLIDTGGRVVARAIATAEPGFAHELPAGPLKKRIAPRLDVRRLLPMAEVHVTRQTANVLGADDETIARVVIDSGPVAGQREPLPTYVYVRPIRDYGGAAAAVADTLRTVDGSAEAPEPRLAAALAALGRAPQDYTGKLNVELDPDARADVALKLVFRHLHRQIARNLEGTIADTDAEFLHDFRVAVRRTRSLLARVRRVLPTRSRDKFRAGFKWLGNVTSEPRDLDVYVIEFADYRADLPEAMRGDLEPLLAHLAERRDAVRAAMSQQLRSKRYAALMRDWKRFVTAAPSARPRAKRATWPIRDVANTEIWRAYRKVRKQGRAITRTCPADDLHELRKSAKQLRYLLEAFRSVYPADAIGTAIATLKKLQNVLGTFQDLNVHGDALRAFSADIAEAQPDAGAALVAMGVLADRLAERSLQVREDFFKRFARFDAPPHRALMKQTFRP